MGNTFTLGGGCIVAELNFDSSGVHGAGVTEYPMLRIQLRSLLRAHKDLGYAAYFRDFHCRLYLNGKQLIAESSPYSLNTFVDIGKEYPNQLIYLNFQLDQARLALIERERKGDGLRLRLDMELFVEERYCQGHKTQVTHMPYFAIGATHRTTEQMEIAVSHSEWVERVLPSMGYGKIHLIELPLMPLGKYLGMKASIAALEEAQKLERQGFYQPAVASCRKALEPFFETNEVTNEKGEKVRMPKLKTSWETKLGKATYDWLDSAFRHLKQAGNKAAHHSSKSFDQVEAQMLLTVTTAFLAYAANTVEDFPE